MNITGVIHIGAHNGQENWIYNQVGIKNRIYFEPMKQTFGLLKRNVCDNYILINKALGNENKKVNLFISSNNGGVELNT
jgi:FkbM family methyltransferase